jgi:hypothetical protein
MAGGHFSDDRLTGERSMKSEYTTVLDAGTPAFPVVPLVVVLAMPVLLLAFGYVARQRSWRSAGLVRLALWGVYLSYVPMVTLHYWSLLNDQSTARNATLVSVEAGRLDWPTVRATPDGLFLDVNQGFTVNGVEFQYRHHALRYLDFLLPGPKLVTLPLEAHVQVRITYRGDGGDRQLLRFEIATRDLDGAHD